MNYSVLALIGANIIWGSASAIFKFALRSIPPFTLAFIRFFFASALLLPFLSHRWKSLNRREWREIIVSSFFGIFIHITFFFLGLNRAPSINASIILSSAPVFLFIGSILFLKEKMQKKVLIGMGVACIGVALIVAHPLFIPGRNVSVPFVGNLYFVISAISGMVVKPLLNKSMLRRISTVQLTFLEFVFGALMFFPFMLGERGMWSVGQLGVNGWTGIIFGVFFSSFLAYFLFNWGIAQVSAQEVGIFYYVDPLVGLFLGAVFLSEYPTIYYGIGAAFVFFGIFIAENRLHYHPIHRLKR